MWCGMQGQAPHACVGKQLVQSCVEDTSFSMILPLCQLQKHLPMCMYEFVCGHVSALDLLVLFDTNTAVWFLWPYSKSQSRYKMCNFVLFLLKCFVFPYGFWSQHFNFQKGLLFFKLKYG